MTGYEFKRKSMWEGAIDGDGVRWEIFGNVF